MNLWKISQTENNKYETYDSCIVAAETEEEARNITPEYGGKWHTKYSSWCSSPSKVSVEWVGSTSRELSGIILSSFNAG